MTQYDEWKLASPYDYASPLEEAQAEIRSLQVENEKLQNAADEIDDLKAQISILSAIEVAARNLADYVEKSVNAGPVTKGPHKEAKLWLKLRETLEAHQ